MNQLGFVAWGDEGWRDDMVTRENGAIAVFGGTGQQGGAVVDALLGRGARVRALVRDPGADRARALGARGVELATVRIDDPGSVVAALEGVGAFYFMTPEANSLEEVEEEVRVGVGLVDAAVAARVPHVVFNSVFGADRETGVPHHDSKHRIEEWLKGTGLRATMVRPAAFMENFATVMAPSVEEGVVVLRLPLPEDVALKLISIRDIGLVAAAVLVGAVDVPGGAVEVVGDELTGAQMAAAFGARVGLPSRYEALPLSVLGNELDRVMFRQFAEGGGRAADFAAVRAIEPSVWGLEEWIRSSGWGEE
ncbi:NmrA/HSCARG family protein [Actinosynnema mirum]|uniref:NmrA family protein n=1 Tax=Actinosynnema mirum (strain ATCC 29888 / DSM 43827 / JCM 3225 / NBRC 14064 / NCIMB 13271 / NRRL B-12336 / IMRU 3971 / 101) TaxID=446462 RepID=C6WJS9_ACTMD|nr:NmrA family NAD(P)-binding protein [Actinosynnema mirum]ACU36304.1 NmrA family protein [Actinosynnema mirum DSM 43827]